MRENVYIIKKKIQKIIFLFFLYILNREKYFIKMPNKKLTQNVNVYLKYVFTFGFCNIYQYNIFNVISQLFF